MESQLTAVGVTPAFALRLGERAEWSISTSLGFTGDARLQVRTSAGWNEVRPVRPGDAGTVDGEAEYRLAVLSIGASKDITFAIDYAPAEGPQEFTPAEKQKLAGLPSDLPVAEHVADATDADDVVDVVNALLASLQSAGLMAGPPPEEE
jgi:hypothetical protein